MQLLTQRVAERAVDAGSSQEEQDASRRALEQRTEELLQRDRQVANLTAQLEELRREQALRFVPKERLQQAEDKLTEVEQVCA